MLQAINISTVLLACPPVFRRMTPINIKPRTTVIVDVSPVTINTLRCLTEGTAIVVMIILVDRNLLVARATLHATDTARICAVVSRPIPCTA